MTKEFAGLSFGSAAPSQQKRAWVEDDDWGHTKKTVTFDEKDPKTKENTLVCYFKRLE